MTGPERIWIRQPILDGYDIKPAQIALSQIHDNATGYTRTDIHQAALDRIAELEGALSECVEVLALKESPDFPDPQHHERVKALGQEIGFGALMSTASCGWRECAKEQGIAGSEFVAGPCYVTVVETLSLARAVLAKGDG